MPKESKTPSVENNPEPLKDIAPQVGDNSTASVATNTQGAVKPKKPSFWSKLSTTQTIAIASAIIIVGSAGAYFGVILPNSPENVWDTALSNTALGVDKLSDYVAENKEIKGSKINGNFKAELSGVTVDGSFQGAQSEKNGNYKANIGAAGSRVDVEVLTNIPDQATSPDVYLRVNGLSSLSSVLGMTSPEVSTFLDSVNNQWYVVDHTVFDQISSDATGSSSMPKFSADDILAIEEAVAKVNRQYLFTSDPDKTVLKIVKFVGKENIDGRRMYHYQVGINKEHFKAHLTALKDELKNTKLAELYGGKDFEQAINFDQLLKSVDDIKEEDQADVWVDRSTKLIRKIRFSDDKTKSHLDFSLNYNGGSVIPLEIALHSEEKDNSGSIVLKFELDTEKDTVVMDFNADLQDQLKASLKATVEKSDDEVEFVKPSDAKSINELFKQFGDDLTGVSDTQIELEDVPSLGSFDL